MKITHDGLKMLARIFVSCNPIHAGIEDQLQGQFINAQGLSENQLYLIENAKKGTDVDFDEYVRNIPNVGSIYKYEKIRIFAEKKKMLQIDEKTVLMFFGGREHVSKVLDDNRLAKVNGTEFGQRLLSIHLVTPVKITAFDGNFYDAVYENGECKLLLKGLVHLLGFIPMRENFKLDVGQIVLTHYASIISTEVAEDLMEHLLFEQKESSDFMQACGKFQEMNFLRFWNLSKWTKQIANV